MKKTIGTGLLNLGESIPFVRPLIKKWGLRTSKEWFANRIVHVPLPDGQNIKLVSVDRNYLSFELFWRGAGYYEPITALLARQLAPEAGTFLDIGANIGFYSLILSVRQPGLRVVAFEPNPKNHHLLLENVQANAFKQVICEPVALSDSEKKASLYVSASDMSASLRPDFDPHQIGAVEVQTTTLDRYCARHRIEGRVLIKVDVEGHEAAFFRGARNSIAALQPDILAEVALDFDPEIAATLSKSGYHFYPVTDQAGHETQTLTPVVRGSFVFLNYLLSSRPKQEVQTLFERIKPDVARINLSQTSKCLDAAALRTFTSRCEGKPEARELGAPV